MPFEERLREGLLEGATDYSGVKVKLMGSNIETTTGVDGNYVLSTPIGNHDGLIFNSTLFESKNYISTITVTENGRYLVPTQELNQVKNPLQGVLKLNGIQEVSGLKVLIESIDGTYEQEVMVNPDGGWTFPEVPLGEYTLTFFRENDDEWRRSTRVSASSRGILRRSCQSACVNFLSKSIIRRKSPPALPLHFQLVRLGLPI